MKKKAIYSLLLLFVLSLSLTGCPDKKGSAKSVDKDKMIENPSEIKDDGSWVYILDKRVKSKEDFEEIYNLYLKMESAKTGINPSESKIFSDPNKIKHSVVEQIIGSHLKYTKAIEDPFFKGDEGKNLIASFRKQALVEYYIYKEILSKVKKPTQKDIEEFYKTNKPSLEARGVKDLKAEKNLRAVRYFYRTQKAGQERAQKFNKLILEKKIERNEKVLADYVDEKITKKAVLEDKEGKYWLIKVDGKPLHLSKVISVIDNQLESLKKMGNLNKSNKPMLVKQFIIGFREMEVGYRAALEKKYNENPEGQKYILLRLKRMIADYYLATKILGDIKLPTAKEVEPLLKNEQKKKMVIQFLKSRGKAINKNNLIEGARFMLRNDRVLAAKLKFENGLKESHQIRISEKYFESKADKIQKEEESKKEKKDK